MPQTFFTLPSAQVTVPGVNYNWADINISALVPAGATGAILHINNNDPGANPWCVRPVGSAFTLGLQTTGGNSHCFTMVGLDANRVFEFNNVSLAGKAQLDLFGYTMPGAEFLPDLVDISPAAPYGVWTQVNLGPGGLGLIPANATGVMVDIFCYVIGARDWGLRMNGSTDNRTNSMTSYRSQGVMVIGCDANQIIEAYRMGGWTRFYLAGYITDGCTFFLNGVDVTPAIGPSAWGPLGGGGMPVSPVSVMGFLEIHDAAGGRFNLYDGLNIPWGANTRHLGAYCPCDEDPAANWRGIYEFAAAPFFNVGYAHKTLPEVQTNPATGVVNNSAQLNATLDTGGLICHCRFEWGETPAYGKFTPIQNIAIGVTSFNYTAYPLKSNTTYYFRAFAENETGTSYGAQRSFTTMQLPYYASTILPSVQTNPATLVTEHAAQLNGVVVEDGGVMGATRFQWGLTTEYGTNTPWQQGYGKGDEFFVGLYNLGEGEAFHFRAQFRVGGELINGNDMVFNTLSPLGPVTLITDEIMQLLER